MSFNTESNNDFYDKHDEDFDPYHLDEETLKAIEISKQQILEGKTIPHEESKRELYELLEELQARKDRGVPIAEIHADIESGAFQTWLRDKEGNQS